MVATNELLCLKNMGTQILMSIQPIYSENGPNGLNWHCCLAGSPKRPLEFDFFSITFISLLPKHPKNLT